MELIPQILTHPNIPKPLHGLNPRNVLGKDWWDTERRKAQAKYLYRCAACGTTKSNAKKHKWLEGHEFFNINYGTGLCEVVEIVPLCHYCHNFIHSGRLSQIAGAEKTVYEVKDILSHGLSILEANNLQAFPGTIDLANSLGVYTKVKPYSLPNSNVEWEDWTLRIGSQDFKSNIDSFSKWQQVYLHGKPMPDPIFKPVPFITSEL
jgi:hypothetical protein